MIFVTVGSQKFQFNRLLKEIDRLIDCGSINANEIFAQIGYSTYKPKQFNYKEFLNKDEFVKAIDDSTIIITHGGTGSIINGVKRKKKVIGIARLKEYGEHVDNHQIELIEQFSNSELIYSVTNIEELGDAIEQISTKNFRKYQSNTDNIIHILEGFLSSIR